MNPIPSAARNLIEINFGLHAGDELLLIASPGKTALARALDDACSRRGIGFATVELRDEPSYELPDELRARLGAATAVLISTERSYTHTDGVRGAAAAGVRIATNSRLTERQLAEGLLGDYAAIAERAARYGALLEEAGEVTVRSGDGAELTFRIEQQRGLSETGLYDRPGALGNLPAGEAACGIDDDTGEGVLVVDGSWPGLGLLDAPLELTFERGAVVAVRGARAAELESILERHGPASRRLAELGVGMNPAFEIQGNTLLDEKIAGTVHVAVGNDVSFGGSNDVGYHADGVVRAPELFLDGRRIALPTG